MTVRTSHKDVNFRTHTHKTYSIIARVYNKKGNTAPPPHNEGGYPKNEGKK